MILFVADQIASAEYLSPLLRRWRERGTPEWKVYSSALSARRFGELGMPFELVSDPSAAGELVARDRPRRALLSASGSSELEHSFRVALREAGVPCYQFIDMWVNYAMRFRRQDSDGGSRFDFPDGILTLDHTARQAMIDEGIPGGIIHILGQPYFEERYRSSLARLAGAAGTGKTMLVSQPVARYRGRELGYDEHDFLTACLEGWAAAGRDWKELCVAIHPEEDRAAHVAKIASYSPSITLTKDTMAELASCSLVIGMYSSLLIQALLQGIPAVSVQPGANGIDACHLSANRMIPRLTSASELAEYLRPGAEASRAATTSPTPASFAAPFLGSCDRLEAFLLESI